MKGRAFYDDVSDALGNFLPPSLRGFESYRTSHNIKVWYSGGGREHYEVQSIRRRSGYDLEVGFHTEHSDKERNEAVIERLMEREKAWRKQLGAQPEAGPFIGHRSGTWRRISELWQAVEDPHAAVEAAERLATYIHALEPIRSDRGIARSSPRYSLEPPTS